MGRVVLTACLPWAGLLVGLVACLWVLARLGGRGTRWGRLARLHADQRGAAASLSFVLVLPFFVMVVLLIIQISQVMIGTIVVHYAALAAARAAVVWIPARLGTEPENCVGPGDLAADAHVLDPNSDPLEQVPPSPDGPTEGGLTFLVAGDDAKLQKIRAAALAALAPVCPSRDLPLALSDQGWRVSDTMTAAYQAMAPGSIGLESVPRRMTSKLAYAEAATDVKVTFYHRNTDAPHWPPPSMFYVWNPPGTPYFLPNEMDWQDEITITVHHEMALLSGPFAWFTNVVRRSKPMPPAVAARIGPLANLNTYPLSASITLGNEGQKSVIPYVHAISN